MSGLEQMRRGSVVEQFVEMVKADGSKVRRGPYALYSYKENKKTVSRRVTDSKLIQVYRRQIQAFRRFQELTVELISLGEKISNTAISDTEEKTAEVFIEQDKEVSRILEKASKEEKADLEAWEKAIRVAVLSAGARALEGLITTIGSGKREEPLFCVQATGWKAKDLRKRTPDYTWPNKLQSLHVSVPFMRNHTFSRRRSS